MSPTESSTLLRKLPFFSLLALWLVSGCGFHPVYATNEQSEGISDKLAAVKIEHVSNTDEDFLKTERDGQALQPRRDAQVMETKLASLLNPAGGSANPAYSLKLKMHMARRDLGIRGDLRVTRYDILAEADYQLTEIATSRELDHGTVRTKSSFNRTDSEFSTFIAEEDSDEQAARELAQELKERLIYYFSK